MVKECLAILLQSIPKLVKCSLSGGVVPAGFKIGILTPQLTFVRLVLYLNTC